MTTEIQRAKQAAYMRKFRETHPENKEYQKNYWAAWVTEEKRAVMRERVKRWKQENPERFRASLRESSLRRRARKLGSAVGPIDFGAILDAANGLCAICGGQLGETWHFDHIIPLARGGPHTQENLQVAHPLCNKRKAASLPAGVQVGV